MSGKLNSLMLVLIYLKCKMLIAGWEERLVSKIMKLELQAYLRDFAGLVPYHCNKASIAIK